MPMTMPLPNAFKAPHEESEATFVLARDAYVWLAGDGHQFLERGTVLTGRLLRRNEVHRKLVLDTATGIVSVNEEDVEPLFDPESV